MSSQMMQQFQERREVERTDDIVGTDQPHTEPVGMHQGDAKDLLDGTEVNIRPFMLDTSTRIRPAETKQ